MRYLLFIALLNASFVHAGEFNGTVERQYETTPTQGAHVRVIAAVNGDLLAEKYTDKDGKFVVQFKDTDRTVILHIDFDDIFWEMNPVRGNTKNTLHVVLK